MFSVPELVRFPREVTVPVRDNVPVFVKLPPRLAFPIVKLPEFEAVPLLWLKFDTESVPALVSVPFSFVNVLKL